MKGLTMRTLIILLILLVAGMALAVKVEIDIPAGPGLDQLTVECNDVKVIWNKPAMDRHECGEIFLKLGAREFHKLKQRKILTKQLKIDLAADLAAFDVVLPLPPKATPTATPTPTTTPTATPTLTPTPTP